MKTEEILKRLGVGKFLHISPFVNAEDGEAYDVWKVETAEAILVLKRAKGPEAEIYRTFLKEERLAVPRFLGQVADGKENYLLISFVEGMDLRRCERVSLRATLDALISLQERYWETSDFRNVGLCFEKSLVGRRERGQYLNDAVLEQAYARYLARYCAIPRTLCHDDLLPFNVLVTDGRAVIIDWECAGILPYLSSFARLIAHTTEEADAFFYMREADKEDAVAYYYDCFVKKKGIPYTEYRRDLDLFLFYEYCEWIMLGNKYGDLTSVRYKQYLERAHGLLRQWE